MARFTKIHVYESSNANYILAYIFDVVSLIHLFLEYPSSGTSDQIKSEQTAAEPDRNNV